MLSGLAAQTLEIGEHGATGPDVRFHHSCTRRAYICRFGPATHCTPTVEDDLLK